MLVVALVTVAPVGTVVRVVPRGSGCGLGVIWVISRRPKARRGRVEGLGMARAGQGGALAAGRDTPPSRPKKGFFETPQVTGPTQS